MMDLYVLINDFSNVCVFIYHLIVFVNEQECYVTPMYIGGGIWGALLF